MSLEKIAMGAKPDPYNFKIVSREVVCGNTIIVANYPGSLTFGGDKMMLLRGTPDVGATLDPHFLDEEYAVVARFIPNETGLALARLCAGSLGL